MKELVVGSTSQPDSTSGPEARRVSQRLAALATAAAERGRQRPKGMSPESAAQFVGRYFAHALPEDLLPRSADDLVAAAFAHYETGRVRKQSEARVEVRSISVSRACVDVVVGDMPFLVESVSGAILQRDYAVRFVVHPVFHVRRNRAGAITGFDDDGSEGAPAESWIHLEIIGPNSEQAVGELRDALVKVLQDVTSAVADWTLMRDTAIDLADELRNDPPAGLPSEEINETVHFLEWLANNHFTFLGYREYKLRRVRGKDHLEAEDGSGLGILRLNGVQPASYALPPAAADKAREKRLLILTKASSRSTVHRTAYLDYVGIKKFNAKGDVIGERRFLGLLTATAYRQPVQTIPVIGQKMRRILQKSGTDPRSHRGKDLRDVIESFPRDELFQASTEQILAVALEAQRLPERRQTRLFLRRDAYGRFFSALVFLPRDRYSTPVRIRMQEILMDDLGGIALEYSAQSSDSPLARLEFVIRIPTGSAQADLSTERVAALEKRIIHAARSWDDDLADQLRDLDPMEARDIERVADAMSGGYRANFTGERAIEDIQRLRRLEALDRSAYSPVESPAEHAGIAMHLYLPGEDDGQILETKDDGSSLNLLRLKIYSIDSPILLSRVLPVLQDLGVSVIEERTYDFDIRAADGSVRPAWIYDFHMSAVVPLPDQSDGIAKKCVDAVAAVWVDSAETDSLNSLVLTAGLAWRQVAMLRAYLGYLRMGGLSYSSAYAEAALVSNPHIARRLVDLFATRFDPEGSPDTAQRATDSEVHAQAIRDALVEVSSLDEDRILSAMTGAIEATLRTNFYQRDDAGHHSEVIAVKIDPQQVPELPAPRPYRETWVYSPRLVGTHLRFGAVARGGLRWSDRREDLRTEILGLVKAQMVKNTVIVPTGAKGGFVSKRLPDPSLDRDAWLAEGVACYRTFIRTLLTLTDNRVGDRIVPPEGVVRHDGDDPYLVVAADKGTATFSDYANEEAVAAGFWLGDAFASGGSVGYDHKAMGITARGAWESVKRHFRELGHDTQTQDFTAIGIGDMSGDVFGNGMLLSEHIRLVAAFDHRHIFIDPAPDAATSHAERKRLFGLPRSSWADYRPEMISEGGGVWPRTAKSIPLTPQIRTALGIDGKVSALTPVELIRRVLVAPVDLFWNGGIGTYVKATSETNGDVGDRANDPIRVNGAELRCKVVGEGGNLGFTQLGRIEFALTGNGGSGGRVNTDAIDNSAGVDTSDHEVNIKVLLQRAIADDQLKPGARNRLLRGMTDDVGRLVLKDNYDQNVALAMEERNGRSLVEAHRRLMHRLERKGLLDRELEFLPTDEVLRERVRSEGRGLSSPELAVLLAYAKIELEGEVMSTDLPDDDAYAGLLTAYFPEAVQGKYASQMAAHPLHREIVATALTNKIINTAGITGPLRMYEETGASVDALLRAQTASGRVFSVYQLHADIGALDNLVDASTQTAMRVEGQRVVERGTRWMLRNGAQPLDIVSTVDTYRADTDRVIAMLPDALRGIDKQTFDGRLLDLEVAGVPAGLARRVAVLPKSIAALDIVDLVGRTSADLEVITATYFAVSEKLRISELLERIIAMPRNDRWRAMARGTLRDDLNSAHAELTAQVVASAGETVDERIESWYDALPETSKLALDMLSEIMDTESVDLAGTVVAVQMVRDAMSGTTTTH